MNVPPITLLDEGRQGPVNVSTSIDVLKLVDINEEDYSIEIQFETTHNLKENEILNALRQRDIKCRPFTTYIGPNSQFLDALVSL